MNHPFLLLRRVPSKSQRCGKVAGICRWYRPSAHWPSTEWKMPSTISRGWLQLPWEALTDKATVELEAEHFYCPHSLAQGQCMEQAQVWGEGQLTCGSWGVDVERRTFVANAGPQLRRHSLIRGLLDLIGEALDAVHVAALAHDEHRDALFLQGGQHFLHSPSQVWVRRQRDGKRQLQVQHSGDKGCLFPPCNLSTGLLVLFILPCLHSEGDLFTGIRFS